MSNIIDKIRQLPDFSYIQGCTEEQINEAEQELNIKFPEEYKEYMKEFGNIEFDGTEWTGLNTEITFDVVEITETAKRHYKEFPNKFFVLQKESTDNKGLIVNEQGEVYSIQDNNIEYLYKSISDYLDTII